MVALSVCPVRLAVERCREKVGIRGALGLALVAVVAPPGRAWQSIEESIEIIPSDAQGGECFGAAIATWGSTAAVGAYQASHPQVDRAGAVYMLERHQGGPGAWGEVVKLFASDPGFLDAFGSAVAIHGDTLVVGAPGDDQAGASNVGSAYVFARNQGGPGNWGEVVKLVPSDGLESDAFGTTVAASEDVILVGANWAGIAGEAGVGAAYVFERDQGGPGAWGEVAKLTSTDWQADDHFGDAVAILGNTAVIGASGKDHPGASNAGAVYVFDRDQGGSGTWGEVAKLVSSSPQSNAAFGYSLAIEEDTLVIGAWQDKGTGSNEGSAYVFERDAGTSAWTESQKLISSNPNGANAFGSSLGLSGHRLLVGDTWANHVYQATGAAHVFERDQVSGTWSEVEELHSSVPIESDHFGDSVAISATTILVGAPNAEPGYAFGKIRGLEFDPSTGALYGSEPDVIGGDASSTWTRSRAREHRSASREPTTSGAWPWIQRRTRFTPLVSKATSC